ncbi:RraA family protein [Halotalea alkalilenta]|uniref:RraA family protein n=1 Tax=Halotalea alkalilenta TaxID=376489 RepID=UPI000486DF39|nr:RraA family protein [Halotalea alkalilenta]
MYTINPMPPQVPPELLALFAEVETATVGHWRLFGFMHREIRALLRNHRVVGTAVTLAIPGSDSTLLHHASGMLRPGDVLVIDRLGDDRYACWGGGVTVAVKAAGALAGVVDGPCTDLAEIEDSDFPIWSRGLSPITTRLEDLGGGLNIPVSCGGVPVMPGDLILADDSGVLVLPVAEAESVGLRALEMQQAGRAREAAVRRGEAKLGDISGATARVLAR